MSKGLWIGTGIAIGLALNTAVIFFAQPSTAATGKGQTEPQGADSNNGPMIMGTGGSGDNKHDICWMLFRDGKAKGKKNGKDVEVDRYVLTCYKVSDGGKNVDIVDVRDVSWDLKAITLVGGKNSPTDMFRKYAETLP